MSESKELPLWNDDETDVRPEYQLTYGHALIGTRLSAKELLQSLGFRITEELSGAASELPCDPMGNYVFLSGDIYEFFLVDQGQQTAVFGDRTLFFNNKAWIALSKSHKVPLAVVTRTDKDAYFFDISETVSRQATRAGRETGFGSSGDLLCTSTSTGKKYIVRMHPRRALAKTKRTSLSKTWRYASTAGKLDFGPAAVASSFRQNKFGSFERFLRNKSAVE
jgi:hypothetical protein